MRFDLHFDRFGKHFGFTLELAKRKDPIKSYTPEVAHSLGLIQTWRWPTLSEATIRWNRIRYRACQIFHRRYKTNLPPECQPASEAHPQEGLTFSPSSGSALLMRTDDDWKKGPIEPFPLQGYRGIMQSLLPEDAKEVREVLTVIKQSAADNGVAVAAINAMHLGIKVSDDPEVSRVLDQYAPHPDDTNLRGA